MSFVKGLTLAFLLCLVALCFISPTATLAQNNKPAESVQGDRDQTLKQLLVEVHELRIAVQRATVNNNRFQMLIERTRVEQTHVESLRRELEGVRSQLSDLQVMKPRMQQQIKDAEDGLDRVTDPSPHADLEARIKTMKADFARIGPKEERLRNREAALESEFQAAQAKLNELNSQMDALMNETKGP
jgi:predicted  nucleic acid-binding Zn-ribbon protein